MKNDGGAIHRLKGDGFEWGEYALAEHLDSIIFHQRSEGVETDGTHILTSRNAGSGGTAYDGTSTATDIPFANGLMQLTATNGYMSLATILEVYGGRMLWVMDFANVISNKSLYGKVGEFTVRIASIQTNDAVYIALTGMVGGSPVAQNITPRFSIPREGLHLLEISLVDGVGALTIDGIQVASSSIPYTTFLVDALGIGYTQGKVTSNMGDFIYVTDNAAAIVASRSYLANKYGISVNNTIVADADGNFTIYTEEGLILTEGTGLFNESF